MQAFRYEIQRYRSRKETWRQIKKQVPRNPTKLKPQPLVNLNSQAMISAISVDKLIWSGYYDPHYIIITFHEQNTG